MRALTVAELDGIAGGLARGMTKIHPMDKHFSSSHTLSAVTCSALLLPSNPWGAPGRSGGSGSPNAPNGGLAADAVIWTNKYGQYHVPSNWKVYASREAAFHNIANNYDIFVNSPTVDPFNPPAGYAPVGAISNPSASQSTIYLGGDLTAGWSDQPFNILAPGDNNAADIKQVTITTNQTESVVFTLEHEMGHVVGGFGSDAVGEAHANYVGYQAYLAVKNAGG